jgi:hypothetical protein
MPASPKHQTSLALIPHQIEQSVVEQRASDGYFNATAMCKAAGKKISHYLEGGGTQDFLSELSSDAGIPASELVQSIKGGEPHLQGTWVHPQVAVNLAMWLSPKFAVLVSKWVHEWLSGKHVPAKLPYHLERHMLNFSKVPSGYFSVLQEMTNRLVAPLEANGYRLPEECVPDISQAKMLCKHLREKHGIDTNALLQYEHEFPDGRIVDANLYPVKYLGDFAVLMETVWMPERAAAYFQKRDPKALPALDKLLMLEHKAQPKNAANKPRYVSKKKKAA